MSHVAGTPTASQPVAAPMAGPPAGASLAASRAALDRVLAPSGAATGLANEWYLDADRFALERDVLFGRNWFAVGFEASVPALGDVWPTDVFGMPLFLMRGEDGRAQVFHNVCSHRGMKLVREAGNAKPVLRCPYHSWCYGLDGALRSTPMVGGPNLHDHPDVDRTAHGLKPVRTASWLGVIFATLDEQAADFSDYAAPLMARWSAFGAATPYSSGPDSSMTLSLHSNWKLAVENYLEAYHLPWVHPGLNSYSRIEDHELCVGDGPYAGQISHAYKPRIEGHDAPFGRLAGLSDYWSGRAEYMALYPNALLGVHGDHLSHIIVQPVAPGHSVEHVYLYYFDEASTNAEHASRRAANTAQWRTVFEEDIFAVEGMQQGRHSPGYTGGVITPEMESTTRDFHVWCARQAREALAVGS